MTADPTPETPRPRPIRDLGVVITLGLVAAAGLAAYLAWPTGAGSRADAGRAKLAYVGESSCRECHPGESALHHGSGHARTLRPASDRADLLAWLDGRDWPDPDYPDATFRYRVEGPTLSVERTAPGSPVERLAVGYAFGSGEHATTFVTMTDPDPAHPAALEHRATAFMPGERLGVTPGQAVDSDVARKFKTPMGRILDPADALRCFDCHATRTSDRGPKTLDVATLIPNVSCERCHGPGSGHVAAARSGVGSLALPFGPGRYNGSNLTQLCGHCHRTLEMAPPGAIRPDNPDLARFQPVGMMASACYKSSGGAIRCTDCHDAHARASAATGEATHATCLKCHGPARESGPACSAPAGRAGGRCADCHMPRRDAGQGVLFADHWIRVHPAADPSPTPP